MTEKIPSAEVLFEKLRELFGRYRLPILSVFIFGLAAHNFAFTNKLLNMDEIGSLYGKGSHVASGRWGIKLFEIFFPDYSMPWLWGIVTLALIAIAACFVVEIFKIKSPVLKVLIPAMMVSFPSETGTFCFMFASSEYALVLLMAIAAVYIAIGEGKHRLLISAVLLLFSTATYQAYILVAASFFVLHMMQELLEGEKSAKEIFLEGVKYVVMMVITLIVYYITAEIAVRIGKDHFIEYAFSDYGMVKKFIMVYTSFLGILFKGYFGFVNSGLSLAVHVISVLIIAFAVITWLISEKDMQKKLLMLVLFALFPMSVNGIYLIASTGVIYSVVLYSMISVYILTAILAENALKERHVRAADILKLGLALVIISNVIFANRMYLKEYLMYQNAYSLYTGVMTQVKSTEGFDENSKIAIIGDTHTYLYDTAELSSPNFSPAPVNFDLVNIYTRDQFIKYYVGFDAVFADDEEKAAIAETQEYMDMPCYPFFGSVKMIGDYVVVKFS